MYHEHQTQNIHAPKRRLVLAENYRGSPSFAPLPRNSVYDPPRKVTLQTDQSLSRLEQKEIKNSVHNAIANITGA